MATEPEKIKTYFSRTAHTFDKIYSPTKGILMDLFDRAFRPDMKERVRLTMEYSSPIQGKTFLDIGCGSGRYSMEFAKCGAAKVVGIDFAEDMLCLARSYAKADAVEAVCEFRAGNFIEARFAEKFDVVIAMGVFDYVDRPIEFLKKMCSFSRGGVIASFPSQSIFRTPIRRFRYFLKRCPVYFYTREAIERIIRESGLTQYEIIKIKGSGMDFFIHASV